MTMRVGDDKLLLEFMELGDQPGRPQDYADQVLRVLRDQEHFSEDFRDMLAQTFLYRLLLLNRREGLLPDGIFRMTLRMMGTREDRLQLAEKLACEAGQHPLSAA